MMPSSEPKTLNIIGAGKLGKTLGRLWAEDGSLRVQDVLNSSLENGVEAVSFIGAGKAVASYAELRAADIYLIATPDDKIGESCEALAAAGLLDANSIVFHCSGALLSSVLESAKTCGAAIASIHPIKSFADPKQAFATFAGTFCGVEGDEGALEVLIEAFESIKARTVAIDASFKTVYHAAAVFASNYLVTLLDVAVQAYAKAGMPSDIALQLMEPLVRGTVDNVFQLGPTAALTGPIARGDIATAVKQYQAINAWNENYGALYKHFGKLTSDIAARKRSNGSEEK